MAEEKKQTRKARMLAPKKKHTSIYLLERHEAHLQFLMNASGQSMNDCICNLIDQSIKSYNPKKRLTDNNGQDND